MIKFGKLKHRDHPDASTLHIAKYRKGGWVLQITNPVGLKSEFLCDDERVLFEQIKKELRLSDTQELEGLFLGSDSVELRGYGRTLFELREQEKGRNIAFSNAIDGTTRRLLRSSNDPGKEIPEGHVHCPGCHRTFPTKRLLQEHKKNFHPSLM
jgi:hypothetical protein